MIAFPREHSVPVFPSAVLRSCQTCVVTNKLVELSLDVPYKVDIVILRLQLDYVSVILDLTHGHTHHLAVQRDRHHYIRIILKLNRGL
jgi:hypothetical protein